MKRFSVQSLGILFVFLTALVSGLAAAPNYARNAAAETVEQSIEDSASSWRYADGEVIANPDTDSTSSISLLSSSYSSWVSSYGTSYFGITSGSSTTKVAVSGAVRIIIDVSKWQGEIDWEAVAASGVTAAIIRCGYGSDYESQDDSYFLQNVEGALENGIEIGVYLYSYATTSTGSAPSAESEAAHVLRLLEEAGLDPDDLALPVFLDLEDSSQASLSASTLGDIAEAFCSTIQDAGYSVGIYASKSWWDSYLTDSAFDDASWYRWVARYPTSKSVSSSGVDDTDIWQFTANGVVDGVDGSVDVSFDFLGSGNYISKPSKVTLSSVTVSSDYSSITVKWTKVSDAAGYEVYRKVDDGSYSRVATISSGSTTSWTDTSVELNKTYTYKVRAYKVQANGTKMVGSFSSTKSGATGLTQATLSSVKLNTALTSATITWSAVSGATGYEIYRCTGSGSYSKVKTITSGSTVSWTNSSLTLGKTYTYKIRAYKTVSVTETDENGDTGTVTSTVYGSYSSTKSVTTKPSTVTISSAATTSSGYIKVTWEKVSNADGYVIYRSVNGGSYSKVQTITSNTKVSWTNLSVSAGRVYRYKIRSYKTASDGSKVYSSSYSSVKSVTAKPAKVSISSVSSSKSRTATVKWAKVSGATGYQVAYRIKGTSKWYYVTVSSNSKTFTGLRNKNYYVKVRAYTTYNGTKYYGSWSSEKAMKVK